MIYTNKSCDQYSQHHLITSCCCLSSLNCFLTSLLLQVFCSCLIVVWYVASPSMGPAMFVCLFYKPLPVTLYFRWSTEVWAYLIQGFHIVKHYKKEMFGFIFFLHFLFISVQKMCKSTIKYVGQHIDFTNLIMNLQNKCIKNV